MSKQPTTEQKREFERRFRARGARIIGIRLSSASAQKLADLKELHGCSDRDVIEGLLLGTLDPEVIATAEKLGVSRSEAQSWLRDANK